jgi:hypothetical protein
MLVLHGGMAAMLPRRYDGDTRRPACTGLHRLLTVRS